MVHTLTKRRLAFAAGLAVLAGYVDGFGFVFLGGYFVSFMSGNTTRAGVSLAEIDLSGAAVAGLFIAAFVVGAAAGTAIAARRAGGTVLWLIAVALAAASVIATWQLTVATGSVLALAMGASNTVLSERGRVSFGVTYMTGALVKVGEHLAFALGGGVRWGWVPYLVLWSAMLAGAVGGAVGYALVGSASLWAASFGAAALAVAMRVFSRR
ncbi:YoaK family protein [Microbacterium sp. A1-JK]|uniref:YoaK family protein n=1 Tax=Microbacterium sp. A1-JK TaxID=3177516 RepID=UPI00388A2B27